MPGWIALMRMAEKEVLGISQFFLQDKEDAKTPFHVLWDGVQTIVCILEGFLL